MCAPPSFTHRAEGRTDWGQVKSGSASNAGIENKDENEQEDEDD
jgi:hypothetical protein